VTIEVHIIGASHTYQFGAGSNFGKFTCSRDNAIAFQYFLVSSAEAVNAVTVCEELSREALTAVLGLPHLFCDPDQSERRALGILNDNDLRFEASWSERPKPTEEEIEKRISQHYQKREAEWYRRIIDAGNTPILFICGSSHVESFCVLLRSKGTKARVVCQDWAP
jgi:hypothetical protein